MVILGPSVLIAQYKTVLCLAPHATHLSQVALDLWATFLTIFGLLLTVLLFFTNLGSQNYPREMASKKGSWICPPRSSQKSDGFPTILFLYRSVKNQSRLLWISQVGALTELAQPVLASSECCWMVMTTVETAHFLKNWNWKLTWRIIGQRKSKRKDDNSVSFTFFTFWLNVHCSGQLRDIKVLFEKPFDYDIS